MPSRRNPRSKSALPKGWKWLCPVIATGTVLFSALMLAILFYKNAPLIRDFNDDSLQKFARLATQNLPRDGAVLLCDSDDPNQIRPLRAFLMQAMLAREGRWQKFLVADTQSLNWPPYHRYLHKNYPRQWPFSCRQE